MSELDTSCKKCKAPMKPLPRPDGRPISSIEAVRIRITGYLCDCGHWNDLKRRKGWVK